MKKKSKKPLVSKSDVGNIQRAIDESYNRQFDFDQAKGEFLIQFDRISSDLTNSGDMEFEIATAHKLTRSLNDLWSLYVALNHPGGFNSDYKIQDALLDLCDFMYQTHVCRMIVGGRNGLYVRSLQNRKETPILRFRVECVYGRICDVTIRPTVKIPYTVKFVN